MGKVFFINECIYVRFVIFNVCINAKDICLFDILKYIQTSCRWSWLVKYYYNMYLYHNETNVSYSSTEVVLKTNQPRLGNDMYVFALIFSIKVTYAAAQFFDVRFWCRTINRWSSVRQSIKIIKTIQSNWHVRNSYRALVLDIDK